MKTVYEALLPEPNDGRGSISGGFFVHERDADQRAGDGNVCGTPVKGSVRTVPIFESYAEYRQHDANQARKRALAKLTDEERRLLGL